MKIKRISIFTLVFAMMAVLVGAVSAQDDNTTDSNKRGFLGHGFNFNSTIIQEATGLESTEIREALLGGSTLAELIEANDGDVEAVIAELVAETTTRINETANAMIDGLEEQITKQLNGTFERPELGNGSRFRRGRRGHPDGFGFEEPSDTTTDTSSDT